MWMRGEGKKKGKKGEKEEKENLVLVKRKLRFLDTINFMPSRLDALS